MDGVDSRIIKIDKKYLGHTYDAYVVFMLPSVQLVSNRSEFNTLVANKLVTINGIVLESSRCPALDENDCLRVQIEDKEIVLKCVTYMQTKEENEQEAVTIALADSIETVATPRTFVVGDTHGSYKGLMQALSAAGFNPEIDFLVVLGDTHDGWSEAAKIMDYYMSLPPQNIRYILGNHDVCFIEWVAQGCRMHPLEGHGGAVTRKMYLNYYADDIERHAEWLRMQSYFYIDRSNRLFVHAGWNPALDFLDPHQFDTQAYSWDRDMWRGMFQGRNYAKAYHEVFIGHTPTTRFKPFVDLPMKRRNVWNLDTGAAFNGRVTVMDIDTKEYWQSDKSMELYPLEKGRN